MTVVILVVGVCVVLFVLALLFPRFSRRPQRGMDHALEQGGQVGGRAPGRLGRWLRKPFTTSEKAVVESASAGRRDRGKLPL